MAPSNVLAAESEGKRARVHNQGGDPGFVKH